VPAFVDFKLRKNWLPYKNKNRILIVSFCISVCATSCFYRGRPWMFFFSSFKVNLGLYYSWSASCKQDIRFYYSKFSGRRIAWHADGVVFYAVT